MARAKILITGDIPEAGLQELRQNFDVFDNAAVTDRSWVLRHLHEFDGMILSGTKGDRELLDAGTNLKIISTKGDGFDNVDIDYAKQKGIVVAHCSRSVRYSTAETALGLILATARRFHFYDHAIREGKWLDVSNPKYMGMNLAGETLGIYGYGGIGGQVAKFCQVLGMKVLYNKRHRLPAEEEKQRKIEYADFATLVKEADILSLHAPATPETAGVFNKAVFKQMKKTALLVNVARGSLVKEDDLVWALETGEIAGAGLDVYEHEPKVTAALRKLDNVVLLPHVGTGTTAARVAMAKEASQNLISYLRDGVAINQVNK
ncbi:MULTISPECIES: NAD(P)-dependent oxidoreductase [Limosilactobacillus]|nr:NAD(P)-dependent oxidoreductase [Limosilactobacillus panis]